MTVAPSDCPWAVAPLVRLGMPPVVKDAPTTLGACAVLSDVREDGVGDDMELHPEKKNEARTTAVDGIRMATSFVGYGDARGKWMPAGDTILGEVMRCHNKQKARRRLKLSTDGGGGCLRVVKQMGCT